MLIKFFIMYYQNLSKLPLIKKLVNLYMRSWTQYTWQKHEIVHKQELYQIYIGRSIRFLPNLGI